MDHKGLREEEQDGKWNLEKKMRNTLKNQNLRRCVKKME